MENNIQKHENKKNNQWEARKWKNFRPIRTSYFLLLFRNFESLSLTINDFAICQTQTQKTRFNLYTGKIIFIRESGHSDVGDVVMLTI